MSFVLEHLAPSVDMNRMIKAILFRCLSLEAILTNTCHFSLAARTSRFFLAHPPHNNLSLSFQSAGRTCAQVINQRTGTPLLTNTPSRPQKRKCLQELLFILFKKFQRKCWFLEFRNGLCIGMCCGIESVVCCC